MKSYPPFVGAHDDAVEHRFTGQGWLPSIGGKGGKFLGSRACEPEGFRDL
jgi:hypothetical protein